MVSGTKTPSNVTIEMLKTRFLSSHLLSWRLKDTNHSGWCTICYISTCPLLLGVHIEGLINSLEASVAVCRCAQHDLDADRTTCNVQLPPDETLSPTSSGRFLPPAHLHIVHAPYAEITELGVARALIERLNLIVHGNVRNDEFELVCCHEAARTTRVIVSYIPMKVLLSRQVSALM